MMTPSPRHETELLRSLGTEVLPVEGAETLEARRDRVTSHLAAVMQREAGRKLGRRRLVRSGFALLAVAAALLIVVGWAWRRQSGEGQRTDRVAAVSGPVLLVHSGVSRGVGAQSSVVAFTDEVRTEAGGHARLDLAIGASVLLSPETSVRLLSASASSTLIELPAGRIEVEVPKLGPAGEFRVVSPQAVVVVHGTRFVVEVAGMRDGVAPTTVKVIEGRVGVWADGREVVLDRGAGWTNVPDAADSAAPASSAAPSAPDSASTEVPRAASAAPPRSAPHSAEGVASTLSEENRLFRLALESRRRGDLDGAIRQLDQLLSRYPRSTLAQEARIERIRCLKQLGRDQSAAEEARKYLAEHPHGSAREEARDVALPPAPSSTH